MTPFSEWDGKLRATRPYEDHTRLIGECCEAYGVTGGQFFSGRRTPARIASARRAACFFLHELAGLTHKQAGRVLGVDHTTVVHHCQLVKKRTLPADELPVLRKLRKVLDRVEVPVGNGVDGLAPNFLPTEKIGGGGDV